MPNNTDYTNAILDRALIDELKAEVARLHAWIIEADAAFNVDNKPAVSVDECAGLVRMCHEGAAALEEVTSLSAELDTARDLLFAYHDENDEWRKSVTAYLVTT